MSTYDTSLTVGYNFDRKLTSFSAVCEACGDNLHT
jgi:hypothetical protein